MSTKTAHTLNHWWRMLRDACHSHNGDVTAGQVARFTGVSRNTAKKWCDRLIFEGVASLHGYKHSNGLSVTTYYTHDETTNNG